MLYYSETACLIVKCVVVVNIIQKINTHVLSGGLFKVCREDMFWKLTGSNAWCCSQGCSISFGVGDPNSQIWVVFASSLCLNQKHGEKTRSNYQDVGWAQHQ